MNGQLNLPELLDAQELIRSIEDSLRNKKDTFNELEGSEILFSPEENLRPLKGWSNILDKELIPINNNSNNSCYISSIDSSSTCIAETPKGSVYATKAGIAIAYNKKPTMHFKIGPMLLYINELPHSGNIALLDQDMVKRMIRVRIERLLQYKLSDALRNSIILIDGSLKISLFEDKQYNLINIIDKCKENGNKLVGISKVTRLKLIEKFISLFNNAEPSYLIITEILRNYISNILGNQLLVKLSKDGLVFRADIIDSPEYVLPLISSNDALRHGYPETLRLAHHLSTFSKTEILAIISIISSRFNINEVDGCDIRKIILGKVI